MIWRAIFFWQPMASLVTVQPRRSSSANSAGIAVISLLLSATLNCPNTSRFFPALPTTEERAQGNDQDVEQGVPLAAVDPRIGKGGEMGHEGGHGQTPAGRICPFHTPAS